MRRFVGGLDRGQSTLFPECLEDWIGEDNPVRVIDVFVDELDLAELRFDGVEPEATGRPSYHPSALLKLYKIHAVVDTNGLPVHLALTPGEAHDNRLCSVLLSALLPQTILLADRGYDADWIRELARQQGAWANIPPKRNRKDPICFSPYLYRARNLIERFFNKIKQSTP